MPTEVENKAIQTLKDAADKASSLVKDTADKASSLVKDTADRTTTNLLKTAADKAAELLKGAADKATEALANSLKENELLKYIFDSINQTIYVTDMDDRVTFYNKEATRLLGELILNEPAVGRIKHMGFFLPDQTTPWPSDQLPSMRIIRSGQSVSGLMYMKNKQKPEGVWIMNYAYPLKKDNQIIVGAVVIFKEIIQAAEGLPMSGNNVPPIPF